MVSVRRIKISEGAVVRELRLAALAEAPTAFGVLIEDEKSKSLDDFEDFATDRASSNRDAFFVALDEGSAVGMAGAFFDNSTDEPFICSMWVSPQYRRETLGLELLGQAKDWLAENGAKSVFAWVTTSNRPAIKFYEAAGFTGTDIVKPRPSNPQVEERLYVLQFTAA